MRYAAAFILAATLAGCGSTQLTRLADRCVATATVTDSDGSNPRTVPLRLGKCPDLPAVK